MPATTTEKTQPWKAAWPPVEQQSCAMPNGVEYGVSKGEIAVVDGTAANVKPQNSAKTQPWKAAWPPAVNEKDACPLGVEYGIAKGDIAVVDGTAANVKPAKKKEGEAA